MRFSRRLIPAFALAVLTLPFDLLAASLPAPAGKVILTLSGEIEHTNVDGTAQFDRAMLEALGTHEFTTGTPYTEGVNTWRGIFLKDLLAKVGANESRLLFEALDLYTWEVTPEFVASHDVLLAFEKDGRTMRVRDKGPIWALFNWDADPSLNNEAVNGASVWQLRTIIVK